MQTDEQLASKLGAPAQSKSITIEEDPEENLDRVLEMIRHLD